ncbi:MAG TPA: amidase [Alphaproteobacteria bacterium]|nr:amidase [Alphaproteobacteria bacterium]
MVASAKRTENDLALLDLTEASRRVQTKKVSPVELTQACLKRIERLNPELNAFITVTAESALQEARRAEGEIQSGAWKGPLHGIPVAVKDLLQTAGVRTTAASAVLKTFVPREDAEVVRRLKSAGAVLLGKLNLHEFAYGGSGLVGHFGPAKNPWNTKHITGGSSSGSAVAVAAGMCFAAIGTDTAGSIRLPAALCGIVGLKPTYGLVSTRGVIPLSWSLDHVGPMARTAADAALMLQTIASYDAKNIFSRKFPPVFYPSAMENRPNALRLGVPRDFWQGADREVKQAVERALTILSRIAASVEEIKLSTAADFTVVRAEAFAYHQQYLPAKAKKYDAETLRRIQSGAEVSATEYIEQRHQLMWQRREVVDLFEKIDLIVTPSCPNLAPSFAELEKAPKQLRQKELMMLRNTRPFNMLGLPSISIPCGFSKSGLPVGIQITGAPNAEGLVLSLANAFALETDWHTKRPTV